MQVQVIQEIMQQLMQGHNLVLQAAEQENER
jgi:hypothetical protein